MGIFDGISLSNEEKRQRNISLSDVLNIYEIAELWSNDKREQDIYMEVMHNTFKEGNLKGTHCKEEDKDGLVIISGYTIYYEVQIHKDALKLWLDHNGEVLPNNCLLLYWWAGDIQKIKPPSIESKKSITTKEQNRTYEGVLCINAIFFA